MARSAHVMASERLPRTTITPISNSTRPFRLTKSHFFGSLDSSASQRFSSRSYRSKNGNAYFCTSSTRLSTVSGAAASHSSKTGSLWNKWIGTLNVDARGSCSRLRNASTASKRRPADNPTSVLFVALSALAPQRSCHVTALALGRSNRYGRVGLNPREESGRASPAIMRFSTCAVVKTVSIGSCKWTR